MKIDRRERIKDRLIAAALVAIWLAMLWLIAVITAGEARAMVWKKSPPAWYEVRYRISYDCPDGTRYAYVEWLTLERTKYLENPWK